MPKTGTLTKAHLINAVAEANGFTHTKSGETIELLIELIKRSLETGEDVINLNKDSLKWFKHIPIWAPTKYST